MASHGGGGEKRVRKWALTAAALLVMLFVALRILVTHATPYLHDRAEDMLSSRFDSQVEIGSLQVHLFPVVSLSGSGIVLRHHGRTDVPPLITIAHFSAHASLLSLFGKPWHLGQVRLQGFHICIPPREEREKFHGFSVKHDVPVKIDELIADDTSLIILTSKPGKSPHEFDIHRLTMDAIGPDQPAAFEAALTNAAPPGEIKVKGKFGPWQADDPRTTAVSATYTFDHADLSVFKGIAGILSSRGKFGGPLENLQVEGETSTPDFSVDTGGHPMMLKTEFSATVDGTNGDTLLHPVVAHFLNSTLVCSGSIVKPPEGHGKEILLDVTATDAKIQDLLLLAVKSDKPLLTGTVNLHTKFDLPTGKEEIMDRLKLAGNFEVNQGEFTNAKVESKVESLSQRAQGHPNEPARGDPASKFSGKFGLGGGVITFPHLAFSVPGANVRLHGTYALASGKIDFHGNVRLQAKPSQMVKGWFKSLLLKPFDSFFRKNGATQLPIKVSGSRDHPSFGLDFGHKDERRMQAQP
jgi:AsmA-like C-terminal region